MIASEIATAAFRPFVPLKKLGFLLWAAGTTNVSGLITPERILGDVRSVITDPLKSASNED
jgi:hypothetical protein